VVSGFLVALALTCISWTPCGFCTAAAGGENRPKLLTTSRQRNAATVVSENLTLEDLIVECRGPESLAVKSWDKDVLQKEIYFHCALEVTGMPVTTGQAGVGLPDMGTRVDGGSR
jgi:hypothetical protein